MLPPTPPNAPYQPLPGSSNAGSSTSSATFAYLPSGSPQLPFAFTPSPHSLPTLAGQVRVRQSLMQCMHTHARLDTPVYFATNPLLDQTKLSCSCRISQVNGAATDLTNASILGMRLRMHAMKSVMHCGVAMQITQTTHMQTLSDDLQLLHITSVLTQSKTAQVP